MWKEGIINIKALGEVDMKGHLAKAAPSLVAPKKNN